MQGEPQKKSALIKTGLYNSKDTEVETVSDWNGQKHTSVVKLGQLPVCLTICQTHTLSKHMEEHMKRRQNPAGYSFNWASFLDYFHVR